MAKAKVISAFPLCGKTYAVRNKKDEDKFLDSDSSAYSWRSGFSIYGKKVRNPEFPGNYIKHIKENLTRQDIIFVSSHLEVRNALHDAEIPFTIVCPLESRRDEWIARSVMRGDSPDFTKPLYLHWNGWIREIKKEEKAGTPVVWLKKGQYISDVSTYTGTLIGGFSIEREKLNPLWG